eukprot:TRINITY_DN2015_c0_g1_i2.p1 TRINITY_DN2015_c0_g1~~TRINITY_DN2015_c0_g1_i2.p1  ORF type:complete len:236 (-),score=44.27 TRINITY_DN2015_c0_g1_i2:143-850(-)
MASLTEQWNEASSTTKALIIGATVVAGAGLAYYWSQHSTSCPLGGGNNPSSAHTPSYDVIRGRHGLSRSAKKHKPKSGAMAWGWIISGGPGSGKGTQCERITKEFGVVHISTGDILRAEVKKGSTLGRQVDDIMKRGELVADDLIIELLLQRLSQEDVQERGFLLDGFPRTKQQAEALVRANVDIQAFILLDVTEQNIVERVCGRRIDPITGVSYHIKSNPTRASCADTSAPSAI